MHALEQAQLLRIEPELGALPVQTIDSLEESAVEVDRAVVCGKARRDFALDGLQLRRRLRRGKVEEELRDPAQLAAADVEGDQRIVEARRLGAPRDRGDLVAVCAQRVLERRDEMLGRDLAERGQPVRRLPRSEQRIVLRFGHRSRCWR